MSDMKRRQFLKLLGAGSVVAAANLAAAAKVSAKGAPHVVVVGGGTAGATAAKYIRLADRGIKVTIVEPNPEYFTCYRSNEVVVGAFDMDTITFDYEALKSQYGIRAIHDAAVAVDYDSKTLRTKAGKTLQWDKLVVAPGVDFKYDEIWGYGEELAETRLPHAWKAGPQTELLRKQLMALPKGGVVVIAPPANPFRCPPGPYERASLFAEYLRKHNPTAKVIIADAKNKHSKQAAFHHGWKQLYGFGTDNSMIELVRADQGGTAMAVDADSMVLETDGGDIKADLINIIPPQKAARIAFDLDLADIGGWCPVDPRTFESTRHPDVHVVGDASVGTPMPKSGYAANTQAKVAASAIVKTLNGQAPGNPALANTCYSFVAHDYGISVAAVYKVVDGKLTSVKGAGGVSPLDNHHGLEAAFARNWHRTFVKDVFG